jgi:hypothetical protein
VDLTGTFGEDSDRVGGSRHLHYFLPMPFGICFIGMALAGLLAARRLSAGVPFEGLPIDVRSLAPTWDDRRMADPDLITHTLTLRRPKIDGPVECPICGNWSGYEMRAAYEQRPEPFGSMIESRILHWDFTFEPCGHLVRVPSTDPRWPSDKRLAVSVGRMAAQFVGRDTTVMQGCEIEVDVWIVDGELCWAPVGTRPEDVRIARLPIPKR